MERQRRKDTEVEMEVRRLLHAKGLRYRVAAKVRDVPRVRPDIVFPREKVAVFVDGCFWHRCPEHGSIPKSNREWWIRKLEANVQRDQRQVGRLHRANWAVCRIWEHEDSDAAAETVEELVRARREEISRRVARRPGTEVRVRRMLPGRAAGPGSC